MSFNLIASCYDLLSNPAGRIKKEGPLFQELITPGEQVLDLACGTGPQALFLAEHCGALVDAGDLSPDMIDFAKTNRPHPHINYQIRDMSTPPPGPYKLIICVGNSLNLLPSRELAQKTIDASLEILAPDGTLLIHIINPQAPQHQKPSFIQRTEVVEGVEIRIEKTLTPHSSGRHLQINYHPAQSEVVEENAELLDLNRSDLEAMVDGSDLTTTFYGTLDRKSWSPESPDILMLVRRDAR